MVTYMKVSELNQFDIVHANNAQEVAKVVHLWSTSNMETLYERDQYLMRRLDWR